MGTDKDAPWAPAGANIEKLAATPASVDAAAADVPAWKQRVAGPGIGPLGSAFGNAVITVLAQRDPGLQVSVDELAATSGLGVEAIYDSDSGAWRFTVVEAPRGLTDG